MAMAVAIATAGRNQDCCPSIHSAPTAAGQETGKPATGKTEVSGFADKDNASEDDCFRR